MELSLQVQQKQILSQKMQQSVEILQMNAVTLSEYIREFAEENPLVEWNEEKEPVQQENTELLQKLEWLEETDEQNRSLYRMEHEQEEKERETNAFGRKEGQSLREFLLFQINIQKIPAGHKAVLRFLAESTAESGYLEKDAIEMMMEKYPMKKSTAARILAQFQALEPSGEGARNLQECLLIQLKQKNASALSMKITRNYLDELAKNRLSYIAKAEKVSMERLMRALQEIRSCQPKPGSGFAGEDNVQYVVPEFLVERRGEEFIGTTNTTVMPRLTVSHSYVKLLREKADAQKEENISDQLNHAELVTKIQEYKEKYPLVYHKDVLSGPFVVEEIYRQTKGDAIITTEVGQNQMWAAQYFKYKEPRSFLSSGGLGTRGYGLGAALGAKTG